MTVAPTSMTSEYLSISSARARSSIMLAASVPRPAPTPPSVTALCHASSKRVTKVSTPSPCLRWNP
eukprot:2426544-Amphidinium_carterae.1